MLSMVIPPARMIGLAPRSWRWFRRAKVRFRGESGSPKNSVQKAGSNEKLTNCGRWDWEIGEEGDLRFRE